MILMALTCGLAAVMSLALALVVRWVGYRAGGLVCRPADGPPLPGRRVPRSGSLAVVPAALVAVLIGWSRLPTSAAPYPALVGASLVVLLAGLVDDWWHELSVPLKLWFQLAGAIVLIWQGIHTHIGGLPDWANILVTLLWVLGVTNAFNLLDILDGLALGIALLAALTFGWIAAATHAQHALLLCASLVGAMTGVWRFNRTPATLFLGDAGAQWLGFVLAGLALTLRYAPPAHPVALATPILVLGVPLWDTVFVLLRRWRHGRQLLAKSADHCALRWMAQGCSQAAAVRRMWWMGLGCAAAALTVFHGSNGLGITVIAVVLWGLWHASRAANAPAAHTESNQPLRSDWPVQQHEPASTCTAAPVNQA